ncbi:MAG: membrane protein of unknown function [Candidatus Thorarchaeota archaeon]|nr:MAG: membrane protein of unknown function [Candidatus Thorarchaeota archaeon]
MQTLVAAIHGTAFTLLFFICIIGRGTLWKLVNEYEEDEKLKQQKRTVYFLLMCMIGWCVFTVGHFMLVNPNAIFFDSAILMGLVVDLLWQYRNISQQSD